MKQIRIALCQIFVLDGDRSGNFVRIENALRQAAEQGAQLACFPETAILGWVNPQAHHRSGPIPGPDSDYLCTLARKYRIHLAIGLAEKQGKNLYDSALLIDPTGRILLKHRKINLLTELMDPPYSPGRDVAAVQTRLGKIGLLICADTHDDQILNRAAALQPELLIVPYGYAAPEQDWPTHGKQLQRVVTSAAVKTGATVVGTNCIGQISHGPWKGRVYGGQSLIAAPGGTVLATAKDRDCDVQLLQL